MPNPKLLTIFCACFMLLVTVAVACGPGFPWQLLDDRAATLKQMPDTSFAYAAAHLVPAPADAPKVSDWKLATDHTQSEYEAAPDIQTAGDRERRAVEAASLSLDQVTLIDPVKSAETDERAALYGKDLPRDVFYYSRGASGFSKKNYDAAIKAFSEAIAAVKDHPTIHSIWAGFMLGRALADTGDDTGAANAFSETRHLVAAGAPDPLNVAIASYGEEARLLIQTADRAKLAAAAGWQTARADLLKQAVRLYATQNAVDPGSGKDSLLVMADEILFDPDDLSSLIDDQLTRDLVVDYALSRGGSDDTLSFDEYNRRVGAFDKTALAEIPKDFDPVANLLATLDRKHIVATAGADSLAALAYRVGRYDLAAGFAARANTPLSLWVQAKLALRAGDNEKAAKFYADGIAALAVDKQTVLDAAGETRYKGEQSVLTLSRQDYTGAMKQLYPMAGTYWGDVAYLAERVLTVDELKGFVDGNVPAVVNPEAAKTGYVEDPNPAINFTNVPQLMRELLARRLVREGQAREAIGYFSEKNRDLAAKYVNAQEAVEEAGDKTGQAKALYEMAVIERNNGMELMGYEAGPDYEIYDGTFDGGLGQTSVLGYRREESGQPTYMEAYTSDDEARRFANSAAKPGKRYHYRYIAADHASAAADLLPPRSQAFAATLCQAAGYVMHRDDDRVATIYKRYIRQGAAVPWAANFGNDCPDPDFAAARHFRADRAREWAVHIIRRHRPLLAAGGALALTCLLGALAIWQRGKRNIG